MEHKKGRAPTSVAGLEIWFGFSTTIFLRVSEGFLRYFYRIKDKNPICGSVCDTQSDTDLYSFLFVFGKLFKIVVNAAKMIKI